MFGISFDFIAWGTLLTFIGITFISCGVLHSLGVEPKSSIIKYIFCITLLISPFSVMHLANYVYSVTLGDFNSKDKQVTIEDLVEDKVNFVNPQDRGQYRDDNYSSKYTEFFSKQEVSSFLNELDSQDNYEAHMYDTITLHVSKDYSEESKKKYFSDPYSVKLVNSSITIDNTTKRIKVTGLVHKEVRDSFNVYSIKDLHLRYSANAEILEGYVNKEVTLDVIYADNNINNNVISIYTIKNIFE